MKSKVDKAWAKVQKAMNEWVRAREEEKKGEDYRMDICGFCNHPFNSEYHMSDECMTPEEHHAEEACAGCI